MADNVAITAGSGTTIATDDIAGVHVQRAKVTWGPDGTANDADVATGKPLPVQLRGSDGTDRSNLLPVSGAEVQVDDAAFTPGTGKIAMVGAEFDDSAPDSVDEGDGGALRMSGRRELYTQIRDAAGNERGANVNASGQLAVAGPVTNAGTFAVQVDGGALTALQKIDDPVLVDDAAFTPAASSVMMAGFEFDDTSPDSVDEGDAGAARMSANRNIYTQLRDAAGNERGANVNASNQLTVAEGGSALTALQLIDDPVFADDAAFTPGTSKVMMAGAEFDDTSPDSVDEGDAGALRMSANRNLYVRIRDNAGNERGLNIDANGALANVATATENHLGEVGGKTSVFSVTLSTDTAAYASGDLIADTQQMDAFFRVTNGTGVINAITIIDEDNQGAAFYILFMSTSTSLGTENSAPNISDANLTAGLQGIVSVATTDYITISGTKSACIKNIGLPVKAVSGTDDLYIAVLNSTGTPTYTASGLEMRIHALLD